MTTSKTIEITENQASHALIEYLTYDVNNTMMLFQFLHKYAWVKTNQYVATEVIKTPACYNALKELNLWDMFYKARDTTLDWDEVWTRKYHVMALAYESPSKPPIDWPGWEVLADYINPLWKTFEGDPDTFYRPRAFITLANRIDPTVAHWMCASLHIQAPVEQLDDLTESWTALAKAQYAWIVLTRRKDNLEDYYPSSPYRKEEIRQIWNGLSDWCNLVPPQELEPLKAIYALHQENYADTLDTLIQMTFDKRHNQEILPLPSLDESDSLIP